MAWYRVYGGVFGVWLGRVVRWVKWTGEGMRARGHGHGSELEMRAEIRLPETESGR